MAELRALLAEIGLRDAQTVLQSGNAVFSSPRPAAGLEKLIAGELRSRLGLQTEVLVRSGAQLAGVVAANPFPREALHDPSHLVVIFLDRTAPGAAVDELQAAIAGPELVRAGERHLYITYPGGIGESKLTAALIERRLGVRGTGRNWNTVRKLCALTGGEGPG